MSQTSQPWIVVVDDDESQRYATCRVLQRAGYQVEGAATGSVALELAHRGPALFAAYHSGYAIAIYIAACAVISLISASFMPDYTGRDISKEYDAPGSA